MHSKIECKNLLTSDTDCLHCNKFIYLNLYRFVSIWHHVETFPNIIRYSCPYGFLVVDGPRLLHGIANDFVNRRENPTKLNQPLGPLVRCRHWPWRTQLFSGPLTYPEDVSTGRGEEDNRATWLIPTGTTFQ